MKNKFRGFPVSTFGVALLTGIGLLSLGCDTDEDVLEVETPDGEVEVERDTTDGSLEVETED